MASARAQRPAWPAIEGFAAGLARLAGSLAAPRRASDELDEARELLAYWEGRARRLPRWALVRRREAREMARRWRGRVRDAERARYGHGLAGTATLIAAERRMPATLVHRGRQAARLAAYSAATIALTLVLILAAAVAVVGHALLSAL